MDDKLFTSLYRDHARQVYNFIRWITGNCSATDDILQNIFIKVWKNGKVPQNDEEQKRWLYRIARNACLDHFRSSKRFFNFRQNYAQEHAAPYREDDSPVSWSDLASLTEEERSILFLHLKMGYAYKEIGEMMDMSENLVRVRVFRALKRLREKFTKREL